MIILFTCLLFIRKTFFLNVNDKIIYLLLITFKALLYVSTTLSGRWLSGKMQGWGRLEWPDGKTYVGQFLNNQQHGYGRLDTPSGDQYAGQWRDGLQSGRGILK